MLTTEQEIFVEWGHCDPARVVFNPTYFEWIDAADMRLLSVALPDLRSRLGSEEFAGIPLVSNKSKFHSPGRYGDTIQLRSEITQVGAATIALRHEFRRDDELLVECTEMRVWTCRDPDSADSFKAQPIPDDVRDALSQSKHHRFSVSHDQ